MGDDNKKQNEQTSNKSSGRLGAAVAGAIVGAGAAVVAETALQNKETRKKLHNVVDMAKEKAGKYAHELKDDVLSEKHGKK